MRLDGKVVVVTGATRGIGLGIAKAYEECGANVVSVATSPSDKPGYYGIDISNKEEVKEGVKKILEDYGKVDILVNNAGITRDNLLLSMPEDDIDRVIDVNLKGAIYMTKALLRNFIKNKGGCVINISSVVGLMGNAGQSNYAASKAGIIGFTKAFAKEYGKKNIRCNAIAPGYIKTDMTEVLSDDLKDRIIANLPLARLGSVEDVARLALFLGSDESSYITGEVIKVDGGMYV